MPRRGDRRSSAASGTPSERGALRVAGEFHRVRARSAARAPPRVPIWLGAYKPRMLRLIGRSADGWLPSLAYMKPGDLAAATRRSTRRPRAPAATRARSAGCSTSAAPAPTDRSAATSGRGARLALEDGVGSFIVDRRRPAVLRRFAEVARGARAGRRWRAAPRHRRRPRVATAALASAPRGIDYDACRPPGRPPSSPATRSTRLRTPTCAAARPGWCCARREVAVAVAFAPAAPRSTARHRSGRPRHLRPVHQRRRASSSTSAR